MSAFKRHGWQRPLHPLQIVGMAVYSFLVVAFYCFLGLFIGNKVAEIALISLFSFVALSVTFLFIRCCAIDPTDKTRFRTKRKSKSEAFSKLNYGFILRQFFVRFFKRMERRILKTCIRRKYLDPLVVNVQLSEPLLPFPLVSKVDDDAIPPHPNENDIDMSYCSLCDCEVRKNSKHCRTCNRCVEGFDHHCRWLNNCVGKKNYTSFILLMISVLLMLFIEAGAAVTVFVRCFADSRGIELEITKNFHARFPRGLLAAVSVLLVLMSAYGTAALGQLFFFHLVLIRKGMRTYDYILAMREENHFNVTDEDDSDFSSDESIELDSPRRQEFLSEFVCNGQKENSGGFSIKIDQKYETSALNKNQGFRASINPWLLLKMSREKALKAAEKAKERLKKQKEMSKDGSLNPLPFETKNGPSEKADDSLSSKQLNLTALSSTGQYSSSPRRFSSPRRRCSGVMGLPNQKYRNSFDLKLTEVSRELETYISRQVLCSVVKEGVESSPR